MNDDLNINAHTYVRAFLQSPQYIGNDSINLAVNYDMKFKFNL